MNRKKIMKRNLVVTLAALGVGILLLAGCDIGINPLLCDGTVTGADFRIDVSGSSYDEILSVNLQSILEDIEDEIDSIKVYNITLKVDSITAPTTDSTKISGAGLIDNDTLVVLTDVPLSVFGKEQSIFDGTLDGVRFHQDGVSHLLEDVLPHRPLPSIQVHLLGSSSSADLHFTLHVKLYTQVFTTP